MNKTLRLSCLASFLVAATAALSACDTGDSGAPCASNAECAVGQVCNAGICVTSSSQAGASGSGAVGGSGVGTAGSSTAGSGMTAGGAGGGVGAGGSGSSNSSGNGSGGQLGTAGSAGSTSQGGTAGSSAGGSSAGGSGGGAGGGGGAAGNPTVVGECKNDFWPAANNGSVTRYDFKQGTSLPACTYVITHTGNGNDGDWDTVEGISTGDGGYFGAMNTTDYAQGAACGACVEASYNGKKVVLTIVDECPVSSNPKCTKGHIDLSRKAIRQLESNGNLEDLQNVSWHYVKCPANGNVKARLHPNQNPNWQPVVVENGLFPLKTVTLNGQNAMRTGNNSGGNAWIATGQKTPYTVRATDVNNNTITFTYDGDGGLKDVGQQFMCK
jgi:expansin